MPKNKNLILFIGIGFLVTVFIWGFVGGCGTSDRYRTGGVSDNIKQNEFEETFTEDYSEYQKDQNEYDYYLVESGDSLWKIANRNGVTVESIRENNNLEGNTIKIGQKLIIPKNSNKSVKVENKKNVKKPIKDLTKINLNKDLIIYTTKKGDSLWRIAQIHGTTIDKIVDLNGISRKSKLETGQELLIPKNK